MSCNCFKEMKEKLKDEAINLISHDINEVTRYGFDNEVIRFDGSNNNVPLNFSLEYIRTKVNGQPESKVRKKIVYLFMTYCPFCGVEFDKK